MSEYARAALRMLTPFRFKTDQIESIKANNQDPKHPHPLRSNKMLIENNKWSINGSLLAGRTSFRIQENISASQCETNVSQLTMSQLSSSNDSNSNPMHNQRVTSFPLPASFQSQTRKVSKSSVHRNQVDSIPMVAFSNIQRPEIPDSTRLNMVPRLEIDPNRFMYRETQNHAIFPVKQEDAFSTTGNSVGNRQTSSFGVPPPAYNSSIYIPNNTERTSQDRPVSQQSSLAQSSKKRSWMEACLDTLKTPYRKRDHVLSQDVTSKQELKKMPVSNIDTGIITHSDPPDITTSQGMNRLEYAGDIQRRHTDFLNELQQTNDKFCSDLQAKCNEQILSLQNEALEYKMTVDKYQTRCDELLETLQRTMNENIHTNEEKITADVMERVSFEMEKWTSSLDLDSIVNNLVEKRMSQAMASRCDQSDDKLQQLETKILSLTESLQQPKICAATRQNLNVENITTPIPSSVPKLQDHKKSRYEVDEVLNKQKDRAVKRKTKTLVSSITERRSDRRDKKVAPKQVHIPASIMSPKTRTTDTIFKATPNEIAHSGNKSYLKKISETEKAKYITPLQSLDPTRKMTFDDNSTPTCNYGGFPSPKAVFKPHKNGNSDRNSLHSSTFDSQFPLKPISLSDIGFKLQGDLTSDLKMTNTAEIVSNFPSTLKKMKRNNDKVYGKRAAKTFDFDPFDFL